jgi:hypothetical protein
LGAGRRRGLAQQIGGQQQNRRTRASAACSDECTINILVDAIGRQHASDRFRAGGKQRDVVELLKRVTIHLRAFDFLDESDHRNAGLVGFGERRHEQGRGRTVLCGDHRDTPGDAGEAISHRAAHVLLTIGNLSNADRLRGKDDG